MESTVSRAPRPHSLPTTPPAGTHIPARGPRQRSSGAHRERQTRASTPPRATTVTSVNLQVGHLGYIMTTRHGTHGRVCVSSGRVGPWRCGATAQAGRVGTIEGLLCTPAEGGVMPVGLACWSNGRGASGDEGERSRERERSGWGAHRDRSQGDVRPAMAHKRRTEGHWAPLHLH